MISLSSNVRLSIKNATFSSQASELTLKQAKKRHVPIIIAVKITNKIQIASICKILKPTFKRALIIKIATAGSKRILSHGLKKFYDKSNLRSKYTLILWIVFEVTKGKCLLLQLLLPCGEYFMLLLLVLLLVRFASSLLCQRMSFLGRKSNKIIVNLRKVWGYDGKGKQKSCLSNLLIKLIFMKQIVPILSLKVLFDISNDFLTSLCFQLFLQVDSCAFWFPLFISKWASYSSLKVQFFGRIILYVSQKHIKEPSNTMRYYQINFSYWLIL